MNNDINKNKIAIELSNELTTNLSDNAKQVKFLKAKAENVSQQVGDNYYGETLEEKYYNLKEKYFDVREENITLKEKISELQNIYDFDEYVFYKGLNEHWLLFLKKINEKQIRNRKSLGDIKSTQHIKIFVFKDDVKSFLEIYETLRKQVQNFTVDII
ncbi:hypothetical protein [Spiroplasma phoeniceum]|uniref:Uncharacterized protein n=2 Tax=Spiroplasma TaxID=2132 RepID=Q14KE5_SPICI|nr:hypothetical protein [Spiroplasma phoeniceum]AXF95301.1 hypothetical protein SDAV_00307 [Spiroplasma phoeniceum P40]CAL00035.1 hypothetical protein SPICINP13_010 [Spiroplasma citri]